MKAFIPLFLGVFLGGIVVLVLADWYLKTHGGLAPYLTGTSGTNSQPDGTGNYLKRLFGIQ